MKLNFDSNDILCCFPSACIPVNGKTSWPKTRAHVAVVTVSSSFLDSDSQCSNEFRENGEADSSEDIACEETQ
jgi:hypothetical protein